VTASATRAATAGVLMTLILTLTSCGASKGLEARQQSPAALGTGHQKLEAGAHLLDLTARDKGGAGAADLPTIEITLPDGWFNFNGWAVHKGRKPNTVFVTFWDVDDVYPTPCNWKYKPMVDPGPSVDGLASALATQPLRNATSPTDVVLGGFRGKYLQWSVPSDIAFDEAHADDALFPNCDEATFQSWTARGWAGDRYQQKPGQVDWIWILDLDGQRLVVDASHLPGATRSDRAELEQVVNSIRFLGSHD
jgi:hypothetical protein